eukprot:NODE_314_length_1923_cov_95.021345_g262_i0.p1 GENE.NODE_314_length_1923_cov_95.021345_g262_i0~~NODE_314_length_1923_cov_95.021345_g262_i0.p1  ORF type:complete len:416 (-),score=104.31 NODE_314_length_1923_cov_95.021345_g262_i0:111-1358(-)
MIQLRHLTNARQNYTLFLPFMVTRKIPWRGASLNALCLCLGRGALFDSMVSCEVSCPRQLQHFGFFLQMLFSDAHEKTGECSNAMLEYGSAAATRSAKVICGGSGAASPAEAIRFTVYQSSQSSNATSKPTPKSTQENKAKCPRKAIETKDKQPTAEPVARQPVVQNNAKRANTPTQENKVKRPQEDIPEVPAKLPKPEPRQPEAVPAPTPAPEGSEETELKGKRPRPKGKAAKPKQRKLDLVKPKPKPSQPVELQEGLLDEEESDAGVSEDDTRLVAELRQQKEEMEHLELAQQRRRREAEEKSTKSEPRTEPRTETPTPKPKPSPQPGIAGFTHVISNQPPTKRRKLVTTTVVNEEGEFVQEDHWTDDEENVPPEPSQKLRSPTMQPSSSKPKRSAPAAKKAAGKSILGYFSK